MNQDFNQPILGPDQPFDVSEAYRQVYPERYDRLFYNDDFDDYEDCDLIERLFPRLHYCSEEVERAELIKHFEEFSRKFVHSFDKET